MRTWSLSLTGTKSKEQFERFLADCRPVVYRAVKSIVLNEEAANDVTQEALLTACKHEHHVRAMDNPRAWVLRIAVNRAIDHRRTEKPSLPLCESIPAPIQGSQVKAGDVAKVLARLKPDHALILTLYHVSSMSYAEVSDVLEIPEGTVASRLSAARESFRRAWEAENGK